MLLNVIEMMVSESLRLLYKILGLRIVIIYHNDRVAMV